jgi:hypothetical protein
LHPIIATVGATIYPYRIGEKVFMVDIDAKEQKDLKGEAKIQIIAKSNTKSKIAEINYTECNF